MASRSSVEHNARYGWPHRRMRAVIKREVDAGLTVCWRCGLPIVPGQPWDLGHVDGDPSQYAGPEHRKCNRATNTHRAQRDAAATDLRPWSRCWVPGTSDARCLECRTAGAWLCQDQEVTA